MKNGPKDAIVSINIHMITPSVMVYVILTTEVFIGHKLLYSNIQKGQTEAINSKLKNACMDAFFGIHTHIIVWSVKDFSYIILRDH